MVEVLAVRPVDRLLVLQPLQHHERGIQERHREQDKGQHEGDDRRRLDSGLDRDHAHQQSEQVGPTISHEARRWREVEEQEAECGAGRQRGQHPWLLAAQIEGDDRHRGGDDHADARGQAVDPVGEVDHVHHRNQADHRQDRPGVRDAGVGKSQFADERQRYGFDGHPEVHDDHGGHHLAGQLGGGRQIEAIVERAHERDHPRGEQHTVPKLVVFAIAAGQPHERRDEHAGEDRQPAQERRRPI